MDPKERPWFIFGDYPNGYSVDVSDGESDVLEHVPRAAAEVIIADRDYRLGHASRDARVLALLKRIEWADEGWCAVCGQDTGLHKPDCELAALIRELEG